MMLIRGLLSICTTRETTELPRRDHTYDHQVPLATVAIVQPARSRR